MSQHGVPKCRRDFAKLGDCKLHAWRHTSVSQQDSARSDVARTPMIDTCYRRHLNSRITLSERSIGVQYSNRDGHEKLELVEGVWWMHMIISG